MIACDSVNVTLLVVAANATTGGSFGIMNHRETEITQLSRGAGERSINFLPDTQQR